MFDPNAQQKAAKAAVERLKPLTQRQSNQAFISGSIRIGREAQLSKHDICKNIERKLGPAEAKKAFNRL